MSEPNDEYVSSKLWLNSLYKLVFSNKNSITFPLLRVWGKVPHQQTGNVWSVVKTNSKKFNYSFLICALWKCLAAAHLCVSVEKRHGLSIQAPLGRCGSAFTPRSHRARVTGSKVPSSATWGCPQTSLPAPRVTPSMICRPACLHAYRHRHLHKSILRPDCFTMNFRESFLASGFISIYLGQWLPTLLSYCYIKEHSLFSQAESCWLHSSALIRYAIRSYILELSIDQRYDQWQPLNTSESIFPEIFSFKRT